MKIPHATLALLTGVSVICSSCVVPDSGYVSYAAPGSVNAGAAWTNASYDANGFPIFGYSYGRPVYGYTAAGTAIFTIAALTALCFVPHWSPAWWYHGPYHYPHGIHRVPAPPAFPRGHHPNMRPPGGTMPPPRPSVSHPKHPGVNGFPRPASPGMRGPGPAFSTMPAPGKARVAPVPRATAPGAGNFPKPAVPRTGHPITSTMPAPGGTAAPRPIAPGTGKPAISTMPAPGGTSIPKPVTPGVSSPRISTMPATGGFSIPKPTGVSAPTTTRIGPSAASSGGGAPRFSSARSGIPMPRGARR